MSVPTYLRTAALGLGLGLLAACSSPHSATPPSPRPSATSSPTTSATSSATSAPAADPALARCGPPGAPGASALALKGPGGSSLPGLVLGHGRTVAVFLHQTDGGALCGWLPYAQWLVAAYPVQAVLFDLCRFGASDCPDEAFQADQLRQVALAVTWARTHGATRVVVVGASMGGALALAAGPALHADALVDLSGPADWPEAVAATVAPTVRIPALIAASPSDTGIGYPALHAAYATIPAKTKRFVVGSGAHGWDLLGDTQPDTPVWEPLATTVARWITGRYS